MDKHTAMQIKNSYIILKDLRFYAYHGVFPQERVVGGEFSVSMRVGVSMASAMEHDMVEVALNYATLYEVVEHEMLIPSDLLEHVAGRIGQAVMDTFPQVTSIEMTVMKLNPPMNADSKGVGVELYIER